MFQTTNQYIIYGEYPKRDVFMGHFTHNPFQTTKKQPDLTMTCIDLHRIPWNRASQVVVTYPRPQMRTMVLVDWPT